MLMSRIDQVALVWAAVPATRASAVQRMRRMRGFFFGVFGTACGVWDAACGGVCGEGGLEELFPGQRPNICRYRATKDELPSTDSLLRSTDSSLPSTHDELPSTGCSLRSTDSSLPSTRSSLSSTHDKLPSPGCSLRSTGIGAGALLSGPGGGGGTRLVGSRRRPRATRRTACRSGARRSAPKNLSGDGGGL